MITFRFKLKKMEFAVHTVLLLTILYTTLTRAQNLDPKQIAPNIPSISQLAKGAYYGSENEVISSNDNSQNDYQPYISGEESAISYEPQGFDAEIPPDGMMCTNVSMWSPVYWTAENVTECACEIETKKEVEMKKVCMDITSMNCTLELSLNCSKTSKNASSNIASEWIPETMVPWNCTEGRITVWHNKTAVECKKIPTYYCDSIWEIQEDGTKVWAGNNQCDYYEWEDCQLVTKPVKFEEPYVSCKQEGEIPFRRLDNDTKITNLVSETCEIVNCVQCLPVTENICKDIEVVKTYQEIIEKCTMVVNLVPSQDFEHIEKCFFNQNPTTGGRSREPIDCFICDVLRISEPGEPPIYLGCNPNGEGSSESSGDYPYNYCVKARVGNVTIRGIGFQEFDPASIGITSDTCQDDYSSNIETQLGNDTFFDRICVCFSDNCNEGEI